jgi:cytidine deaminase
MVSIETVQLDELNDEYQTLLEEAHDATERTYSPYSEFNVGAALLTGDGEIVAGANIENSAYSFAMCAERTTFFTAFNQGHRDYDAIAIIGRPADGDDSDYTFPCGGCRQVLYEAAEISGNDIDIILGALDDGELMDEVKRTSTDDILPEGFGPSDLEMDVQQYLSEE